MYSQSITSQLQVLSLLQVEKVLGLDERNSNHYHYEIQRPILYNSTPILTFTYQYYYYYYAYKTYFIKHIVYCSMYVYRTEAIISKTEALNTIRFNGT